MHGLSRLILFPVVLLLLTLLPKLPAGEVHVAGELKQWHKVTLTIEGPTAREADSSPNPFLDYRFMVTFNHESGSPTYVVPGYFAADGNAAQTSASQGNQWRVHLAPDKSGRWNYALSFLKGNKVAIDPAKPGEPVAGCDGLTGSFDVTATDKTGRDFRGKGRLQYVGQRYLRFAGTGEYFLKAGADSPENFLAYHEFDGTRSRKANKPARPGEAKPTGLHRYEPHAGDWKEGDPTWKGDRGRNIIGALNYLAGKGCNAFSFLTYNVGGDGDDVWPFVTAEDKLHFDCSKLDQWQIVFDHAQKLGLYLHFKLQETENDDNQLGNKSDGKQKVAAALDGGDTGLERRLYLRELIARFGYALALNWNLGEENTQSPAQQKAMALYLHQVDPYQHNIVVHTYPDWQNRVYEPLLGKQSVLTGASLQNSWQATHQRSLHWIEAAGKASRPWVVANDEQNPAEMGVPPDAGYSGFDGKAIENKQSYDAHDVRKRTLWGNLLAGGAGVEYYFGYKLPQNDLVCEDWRSRDSSWDYCRIALSFFRDHGVPFWEMKNANSLVGNTKNDNSRYCFAKSGDIYIVYLPAGGSTELDLEQFQGKLKVNWYNPRIGGALQAGSVSSISGPGQASLGEPPNRVNEDWVILIRR